MTVDSTRTFYDDNAEEYFIKTYNIDLTHQYERFLNYLIPSGHIMDLGCGSGRDSNYFIQHNYYVDALDSSKKLCELVNKRLGIEPINCRIQDWNPDKKYDGIWACASLLHFNTAEFEMFLERLPSYLNVYGVLFASVKSGIPTGFSDDGRFYQNYSEDSIKNTINKYSALRLKELWFSNDSLERDSFRWMNLIIMNIPPEGGKIHERSLPNNIKRK